MQIGTIEKIEGMEFPAGRRTRVMIGSNGKFQGAGFSQGYVILYQNGSIPEHEHETVESYTILKGRGEILIGTERQRIEAGDFVLIPPGCKHALFNRGEGELHMMFVYAPDVIVDHWAQEQAGEI